MSKVYEACINLLEKLIDEADEQITKAKELGQRRAHFPCDQESIVYGPLCQHYEEKGYTIEANGSMQNITW